MERQPLVSVIIPNYNNEKYLPECLDSVINQTYGNLEIIVVNDGSTDGSMDIINDYMSRDSRIKCIDKENSGAALSRKAGLEASNGVWVLYLDGDDFLVPNAIERLVEKTVSTQADIISFPFYFYFEDGRITTSDIPTFDEIYGREFFRHIFNNGGAYWSMWSNFQKRSLFYDYNVSIDPNIHFGEDAICMTQIFMHNPKVATIRECLLNYRQNPTSVSFSTAAKNKRVNGQRKLCKWIIDYFSALGLSESYDYEIAAIKIDTIGACLAWKCFDYIDDEIDEAVSICHKYPELKQKCSRRLRKFIKYYNLSHSAYRLLLMYYRHKYKTM